MFSVGYFNHYFACDLVCINYNLSEYQFYNKNKVLFKIWISGLLSWIITEVITYRKYKVMIKCYSYLRSFPASYSYNILILIFSYNILIYITIELVFCLWSVCKYEFGNIIYHANFVSLFGVSFDNLNVAYDIISKSSPNLKRCF